MRIEILYPELCCLFGDSGNIRYLEKCLPEAEFIHTSLNDTPAFADGNVDMIYMGASTERSQEKIIARLMPYKEQLRKAIDDGKVVLFTGNAPEVLFNYIEKDDGTKTEALGLFDFYAKQRLSQRFNCIVLAKFEDFDIVGFKTQFTMTYGDNSNCYFADVQKGIGINKESTLDGIRIKNFFGTSIIGPLLVLNPYFTEYLMKLLGTENPKCAFRDESIKAYDIRVKEMKAAKSDH